MKTCVPPKSGRNCVTVAAILNINAVIFNIYIFIYDMILLGLHGVLRWIFIPQRHIICYKNLSSMSYELNRVTMAAILNLAMQKCSPRVKRWHHLDSDCTINTNKTFDARQNHLW